LQLTRVGTDDTSIAEWSIEESTHDGWEQDVRKLQEFVNESKGEPLDVVRAIRPAIEGYLRSTCKGFFAGTEWLGEFIEKIRNAADHDPASTYKPLLEDIEDINDYSKRYHHRDGTTGSESIDDAELGAFAERTLDLVGAPPRT